ncbi:DoxX family protein [Pseudonocardia sp.]|uniref:DoxX family protein n=1 Tax=Pseudonocardia sp. TaxID=60912 RepID=UPI002625FED5|nr:DoxX family protein [Pseudonocardia sp.]
MSVAVIVLSVLLALVFLVAGSAKLAGHGLMLASADHLGFPRTAYRLIGVADVAGAAGLALGVWIPALGIAAAAGLVLLTICAVVVHLRAGDRAKDYSPPAVLGVLAGVTLALHLAGT